MVTETSRVRYGGRLQTNRWQDWFLLVLAIWLFFSPWILNFGAGATNAGTGAAGSLANPAWDAWVLGVVLFVVALTGMGSPPAWQQWFGMILGVWIFIAPWVLGFAWRGLPAASWDHWIVGALVS